MSITVNVDAREILKKRGLNKNGMATRYLTNEVAKHMTSYMPKRTSQLIRSMKQGINLDEGKIEIKDIRARYLYYGKVMVGSAPKQVTDIDLDYAKNANALAGPYFDRRMMADKKEEIVRGLAGKIGGKAK